MIPKEAFLAPDILHLGNHSLAAASVRRLHFDDPDGAEMLAGMVDEESVGVAGLAQLEAAIQVCRGQVVAASTVLRRALDRLEDNREIADLSFQIGICALAVGDAGAARSALDRAVSLRPDRTATAMARARLIWHSEGPEAGRAAFRRGIEAADDPLLWGAWASMEGESDAAKAQELFEEALSRHPSAVRIRLDLAWSRLRVAKYDGVLANLDEAGDPEGEFLSEARTLRGLALFGLRRLPEARDVLAQAREAGPLVDEAELIYAYTLWLCADAAAAEAVFRQCLVSNPENPDARGGLAAIRFGQGREDEAEALLENASYAQRAAVYVKLADLATRESRTADALEWYRRAAACNGESSDILAQWAGVFYGLAMPEEAVLRYDAAAAIADVRAPVNGSNAVFLRHYDASLSPADVYAAHRDFGLRFGGQGEDPEWRFENLPDPERRLRIGYVSPDLHAHSVAFFMAPLIDRHDRSAFHLTVYYNASGRDAATDWFEKSVDEWRDIEHLSHGALRSMIKRDRIDILVDLSGHTARNRMMVFARRAAPVQVTYLGYPNTTGLPAMDYRIVDAVTDPPAEGGALAIEQLVRLPRPFLCYSSAEDIPDIAPAPSSLGRPFTFGSFNNALKFNRHVYDAWARILHAVPESRMLLKSVRFKNVDGGDRVVEELTTRGIPPERLITIPMKPSLGEHLATYADLDLCLDPFPYNGTTTTCEAFSMGVPTLTLAGDRHSARVGETLVRALEMADGFLAWDVDDYVRRAVDWAARRADLAAMRPGLRARLKASPLGDERGHARAMEAAYRAMWRVWCAAGPRYGLGPSPFERELHACAKI